MIVIASDHSGVELKKKIKAMIIDKGMDVKDMGCFDSNSVDYPDYAIAAAHEVASGRCNAGVLICGTGIGMSIAANKVNGIRCALCHSEFDAQMAKEHNNANMIAVGVRTTGDAAVLIVDKFLTASFSGEARHLKRIQKIMDAEKHDGR